MTDTASAGITQPKSLKPKMGVRALQGFVLLLPWVYDPAAVEPTGPARILAVQLALCPAMIWALPRLRRPFLTRPAPLLLAAFLIWAGASRFWALDQAEALASWLHLLTFAQVFLLGAAVPTSCRRDLLWAAALSAGMMALLGVVQTFHYEVHPFVQLFPPSATFINKNVAAQFLGALIGPGLALMITEPDTGRRHGLAVMCGAVVFFMIMTGSRTAWLALLITATLALPWGFWVGLFRPRINRETLLGAVIVIVVIVFMMPGRSHRGTGSRIALEQEMASMVRLGTANQGQINTVSVRLATYLNTAMMLRDHPLKGVGQGNFRMLYPLYHDRVRPTPTYTAFVIPAKVHNDLLQTFAELGLPGGLLFTAFLLSVLTVGHHRARRDLADNGNLLYSGILAGFFSLLVISIGSFPLKMPIPSFYFYLWAGLLVGGASTQPRTNLKSWIPILAVLTLNLTLITRTWDEAVASRRIITGMHAEARGDIPTALTAYRQAVVLAPHDWFHHDRLATLIANTEGDPQAALRAAQAFTAKDPYNPNGHFRLAMAYARAERYPEALKQMTRLAELAPPTADLLFIKAGLLIQLERPAEAKTTLNQVLAIDPAHQGAKELLRTLP